MTNKSTIDDEKTFQRSKYRSADLGPKPSVAKLMERLEAIEEP